MYYQAGGEYKAGWREEAVIHSPRSPWPEFRRKIDVMFVIFKHFFFFNLIDVCTIYDF